MNGVTYADVRLGRRAFFGGLVALGGSALGARAMSAQDSAQGRAAGVGTPDTAGGRAGALYNPRAVGRPRQRTQAGDADAEIKAIEQRLACSCGCTLDIFTCRTTDFTCTYSPELHREVLALHAEGKTAQEIIDAFVAKYGEKALMAPKPQGFNLAGYLVPGLVILLAGALLAWLLARRSRLQAAAAGHPAAAGLTLSPGGGTAAASTDLPAPPDATPEELERLRRALAEVED